MSDEQQPSIKVIDRRRSAQGSQDASSSSSASSASAPPTAKPVEPQPQAERTKEEVAAGQEQQHPEEGQVDFASFVLSFYTQTLIMLGEIAHPETGLVSTNFEAARQTIDILSMLESKTKGNLSPEEQRLLNEVVANLQMTYVNKLK